MFHYSTVLLGKSHWWCWPAHLHLHKDVAPLQYACPLTRLLPVVQEDRQKQVGLLQMEIDQLETRLQEASKARETRLRKAGAPTRARMASELREMDQDILILTRALAVRPAS